MKTVRLGAGAGYSGDRIDPAVELAELGDLDYLIFECLAERTMALAHHGKNSGTGTGYDPLLVERMEAVLPACMKNGVRIVSNMGAADPIAAAVKTVDVLRSLGIQGVRVAAITGDDVLGQIRSLPATMRTDSEGAIAELGDKLLSANAYIGFAPVVEALRQGAQIVLTGRMADPSLFVGPLVHEFGWAGEDWNMLGQATAIGHLLECAGQLSGGYFADPGYKDVSGLAQLGFPFADVKPDGSAIFSKVEGSGGLISRATCIEQLLYEIENPAMYYTPDVVANFTKVRITELSKDRVEVQGGLGTQKPAQLKVSLGYADCCVSEGQISYAGPGALARARLAKSILQERLSKYDMSETRFDLIGVDSVLGETLPLTDCEPNEVRLRVVGRATSFKAASMVAREVEALYTNGPSGGGGITSSTKQTVSLGSTLIDAHRINAQVHLQES